MSPANPADRRSVAAALAALLAVVVAALVLACATPASAQTAQLEDLDSFPKGSLTIHTGEGKKHEIRFDIWIADTEPRQRQGLMFVRSLPPHRGMLFVYDAPRPIGMWMKNTYIPLDMLFMDERGRILNIVENTTPHSLNTVSSSGPAAAVLEIAGGEARRLGIKAGHRVSHPHFKP